MRNINRQTRQKRNIAPLLALLITVFLFAYPGAVSGPVQEPLTTPPMPTPLTSEKPPQRPTDKPVEAVVTPPSDAIDEPVEYERDEPESLYYPVPPYTDDELDMIARMVWGEARGCSTDEQRLVVWTVFQRVEADYWSDTVAGVITAPDQFVGYKASHPIDPEIYALCADEAVKWAHGETPPTHEVYAPTLPYYFFSERGRHNYFREAWKP